MSRKLHAELKPEITRLANKYKGNFTDRAKRIAEELNIPYTDNLRKRVGEWVTPDSDESAHTTLEEECDTLTETNQYKTPPKLSALKPDGRIMTVEEFCDFHGLDPKLSRSFKLVTHTGIPYYNIASVNLDSLPPDDIDWESVVKNSIGSIYKPRPVRTVDKFTNNYVLQVILSDVHVGMNTNPDGKSLYGGSWGKKNLMRRLSRVLDKVSEISSLYNTFREVQVIDLGDFMDGLDGQTVRRGHDLPQNMSNEEMFEAGLEFKLSLVEGISKIPAGEHRVYNVCNSNHSSSFDYMVNRAAEEAIYYIYEAHIHVINELKFIGHRVTGNWVDVFCHGKDESHLKFGLKPKLDEKGRGYIEEYLKHHGFLGSGKHIVFHSGDSHLRLTDSATSPDFDYHKYLSLAPASGWVQGNFGRSRSGFTIIVKDMFKYEQHIHNYEFEWDGDNLK